MSECNVVEPKVSKFSVAEVKGRESEKSSSCARYAGKESNALKSTKRM